MDTLQIPLQVFSLEIDGQSLHNRWNWIASTTRPGRRNTTEGVVELQHQIKPITVRVVTRLDGTPILARYLEITNTGPEPLPVSKVSPCAGLLWNTVTAPGINHANPAFDDSRQEKFTLGYFEAEGWGEEGDFRWLTLPHGNFSIDRTTKRSLFGWPYYIVKNNVTGEMFFLGIEWSANYFIKFSHRFKTALTFETGPLGPAPLWVIAPGETITSPAIHLGPLHGTVDHAVGQWHRHLRTSVIPPRPPGREMFTIAGRVVEEPGDWILREVDIATAMGVEGFMVDAGWYGDKFSPWPDQRGDWYEGSWLPGGLAGVRDYIHQQGLLFGLWHEAEAIASTSNLAKQHPDWTLSTDNGRKIAQILNLGRQDAANFFQETVLRVIRDSQADFYKLDFNTDVGEGGQNLRDGWAESELWRHCEALYQTYDRVLRECPNVALENCGAGGGRNDLGMLSRFHYCCESDWSVHPYAIRAINAMTLFIPPEAIAYYHNHIAGAHQRADLDTHLRVTLFATPIFVGFGAQDADRTNEFFRKTRRYIELHKGFCRPVLANQPSVFHHTPDIGVTGPAEWCVLEYAARDAARGYAGVFKLSSGAAEYQFRPRGINPAHNYEVTLDNRGHRFVVAGQELERHGLAIRLDSALTSELVMYSQVK